jgi:hypothetical protein
VTTANGRSYNTAEYKEKNLACQGTVAIRGINNGFDVDCATLNVFNYVFTGADTGGSTYWFGTSLEPFCSLLSRDVQPANHRFHVPRDCPHISSARNA